MPSLTLEGSRVLDSAMIADVVEDLTTRTEYLRPMRFLDRTPVTNATESEIYGIWTGNRRAADIITDNHPAHIVSAGQLELRITQIPNVKIGAHLDQADLNRLDTLQTQGGAQGEDALYDFWFRILEDRIEGVRERQNWLCAQAKLGTIDYDRLGVKFSVNFNVPAALLLDVATPWSTAASATPITDIFGMVNDARYTYGKNFNRMTLSRVDFDNMVATTQFLQRAQGLFGFAIATTAINVGDEQQMIGFVGRLLNMTVEIEEGTFRTEENDGTVNVHRYLPEGKVILDSTDDDNDPRALDLANGIVTESMVAGMVNGPVDLAGQQYGPVGYWAPQTVDLNPPGVTAWACARCFPRRKQKEGAAVLTVN